jgi:hypothetical protein
MQYKPKLETMKNAVVALIFAIVVSPAFAQCGKKMNKDKFATFGVDFGVNRSNLSFSSPQTGGDNITNGLGYRLGLVSNFQLTRRFSFAPKAELSFNASGLTSGTENYDVNPTNLELLGHLKFKLRKGSLSPYIIVGPNARIPIGTNRDNLLPTKEDVAIDLGIGLDVPIFRKRIAPELRYSFGLTNINRNSTVSDVKYHNISLVLILAGRK